VTQGIWGEKHVSYSSLRLAPKPDAPPIEYFSNGLKWTDVLSVCLVAAPVVIALIPFWEAGLIPD
jgi:hypothetical protein